MMGEGSCILNSSLSSSSVSFNGSSSMASFPSDFVEDLRTEEIHTAGEGADSDEDEDRDDDDYELFSLFFQEWIQPYLVFSRLYPFEKICLRQICQDEQLSCLRFVDYEIKVVDFEWISHDMILLK